MTVLHILCLGRVCRCSEMLNSYVSSRHTNFADSLLVVIVALFNGLHVRSKETQCCFYRCLKRWCPRSSRSVDSLLVSNGYRPASCYCCRWVDYHKGQLRNFLQKLEAIRNACGPCCVWPPSLLERGRNWQAFCRLIHGFGEHVARYDHVFQLFAQHGIQTYGYDQRGFGESGKKAKKYGDNGGYDTALNDVNNAVKRTHKEGTPLFLFAHSMVGTKEQWKNIHRHHGSSRAVASCWTIFAGRTSLTA